MTIIDILRNLDESSESWDSLKGAFQVNLRRKAKNSSEIEEAVRELTLQENDLLWAKCLKRFSDWFGGEERRQELAEERDGENSGCEIDSSSILVCLAIGNIQVKIIKENKKVSPTLPHFAKFIALAGNSLNHLVQNDIRKSAATLCDSWLSTASEASTELLTGQVLTCFLREACRDEGKLQDVRRAFALRKGVSSILDEEDQMNEEMNDLIVTCFTKPLFLRCDEGVKLLSMFFPTPWLMVRIHGDIKRVLVHCPNSLAAKYSEVYFRAWKNSQGPIKQEIEQKCLQDLMFLAAHVDPHSTRLSYNLFSFLHYLHQYKKHPPTASLIYSLYEPFLWRSLKAANGYVRMNAATLLCDLFPCSDISHSQEEKEELMHLQYRTLTTLLTDSCHHVRIAVVKGVFSILVDFWLIIPPNVIHDWFQIFLNRLLVDASCSDVRSLVIQGISDLLGCPNTGDFISGILPHVTSAFDDVNPSVRLSFMKLLLNVKATKFIKYWTLVPMEHLLSCLAVENSSVVKLLICQLIFSAFLAPHLSEQEKLQRCVSLIEMNRDGARVFFQKSSHKLDIEATTRLTVFFWTAICRYVQMTTNDDQSREKVTTARNASIRGCGGKRRKRSSQNKENDVSGKDENSDNMPLDNPEVVGGLLDAVVILWTVNKPKLSAEANVKYLEYLRTRISRHFPYVWSFFKDNEDISKTLLYLSSFLPKSHVSVMVGLCLSRIKAFDENEGSLDYSLLGTYVNALCNWNRYDDLVELISEWLRDAMTSTNNETENASKKKRKSGRVRFANVAAPKPKTALSILNLILSHPISKVGLLQSVGNLLMTVWTEMGSIEKLLFERCCRSASLPPFCDDDFLLSCWSDYLCVTTLLNREGTSKISPSDPCEHPDRSEHSVQSEQPDQGEHPDQGEQHDGRQEEGESESLSNKVFHSVDVFRKLILRVTQLSSHTTDSLDVEFFTQYLSRLMTGSADLVSIGLVAGDDDFVEELLQLNQVAMRFPFNCSLWKAMLQSLSVAHHHFSTYGEPHSCLVDGSLTPQRDSLNHLVTFLQNRHREVVLIPSEDLSNASRFFSSTLNFVFCCDSEDITIQWVSSVLVDALLALVNETQLEKNSVSLTDFTMRSLEGSLSIIALAAVKNQNLMKSVVRSACSVLQEVRSIRLVLAGALVLWLLLNEKTKVLSKQELRQAVMSVRGVTESISLPVINNSDSLSGSEAANLDLFKRLRDLTEDMEKLL